MKLMRSQRQAEESQRAMTALLAPLDVSQLLGVSVTTVKRLTATGELPHIRVSLRRPRYRHDDLMNFIEGRRSTRSESRP
jgi:excisionase family DNA binding protein